MKARKLCSALLLLQMAALPCCAETLSALLADAGIPSASFTRQDLEEHAQGSQQNDERRVVLVFRNLTGDNVFTGPPHVVAYDKLSGAIVRSNLRNEPTDVCSGSVEEIRFVESRTLVGISISPSAQCLLVLDEHLQMRHTLYGFAPREVEPGSVVLIESMIHFASQHAERLQLASLATGKTLELYPVQGDPLRAQLIKKHATLMPPHETCMRFDDPCDPRLFDEDIRSLETDGRGSFAFIAMQSASHALVEETPPETVASQAVLYIYKVRHGTWSYCEQQVDTTQIERVIQPGRADFLKTASSCKLFSPVVPDLSTADYNPFFKK